jgi:hypothetical protein
MLPIVPAHGVSSGVQRALQEVWIVVCLAAVHAMWCTAKKVMDPVMAAQPRGLHAVAVQSDVAQFWELLHEFTQYSQIPGAWRRLLPQDTPFLQFPNYVARQLHVSKEPRLIVDAG